MSAADQLVDVFVDAGAGVARHGVARHAARSLADRLIADGHDQALAEIMAELRRGAAARLAHRDRWAAYEAARAARASLDKTGQEPPPPPEPEPDPPPDPPAEEPKDGWS